MTTAKISSHAKYMEEKVMFPSPKSRPHRTHRVATITILAVFVLFSLVLVSCRVTQREFASPADAVQALVTVLKSDNDKKLLAILGPEARELISSGDEVHDRAMRQNFLKAYEKQNRIEPDGDMFQLVIGKNRWPFPIPLVKKGDRWIFDSAGGREEILNRRIGRNELDTIQTLLAIVDAQREYAMEDRDSDSLLEYARRFISEPGKKNGLYWPPQEGKEPSPIGELLANARAEGYGSESLQDIPRPYHGYFYRILTAQGPSVSGGAYDYIVNDKMIGGFAVVAFPAEYGNSGVMTFQVNHEGMVYQKDLGEDTAELANSMTLYDPDDTWTQVQ